MASQRFYYFRLHNHPLGWGVRDHKHNNVLMLGDKNDCAEKSYRLNNNINCSLDYHDLYYSPEHGNIWIPTEDELS